MIKKYILIGHLSMFLFSLLVSISFILGEKVSNEIDPLVISAFRVIIASIFIGILFSIHKKTKINDLKKPLRFLLIGGMISTYFVLMFEGLKTADALSMSIIFTLTPLMSGIFDYLISGRKMSNTLMIVVIIGAVGAIWVIFEGNINNLLLLNIGYGELIFIFGCVCHSLYAALIPKLNRGEIPLSQTFGTLIACSILLGSLSIKKIINLDLIILTPLVTMTIIYLAIFATATSFFLIQFSARRLSSVKVMAYTYAIPFWVAIINGIANRDIPDYDFFIGASLIAFSLIYLLFNSE